MVEPKNVLASLFAVALILPMDALGMDMSADEVLEELGTLKGQIDTMQNRIDWLEGELEKRDAQTTEVKREETKADGALFDEIMDRLSMSADLRIRYEYTDNQPELKARHRQVLRGRLSAAYRVNKLLTAGARLATGSADDPNTTDVTVGSFADDFDFNLTRLYLNLEHRDLFLTAGKFANPFMRTDLVWDGDVNPQGVAGSYTFREFENITPKLTAIYFIVDHQPNGPDSHMLGGQASVKIGDSGPWSVTLAGSYYDYDIRSMANADAGDWRDNNLNPDGTYLSDFDLFDALAVVEYRGFGERYPVKLVGDYVKNFGAAVDEDEGFSVDLFVGKASKKGDFRVRYGYSLAETDSVLAAFSHDNTTYATNYRQHTMSADYVILNNTFLNLTWYLYRRDKLGMTPGTDDDDYVSRLRVNAVVKF